MVWDLVDITKMSKNEVLQQVFPEELEYIYDKKRVRELHRYEGYMNQIMAVAAGFGGGDNAKEYVQDVTDHIQELADNNEDKVDIRDLHSELEELKAKDELTYEEEKKIVDLKQQIDEKLDKEMDKLRNLRK